MNFRSIFSTVLAVAMAGLLCCCQSTAPPKQKGPQASSASIPWDRPTARHNNSGPLGTLLQRER